MSDYGPTAAPHITSVTTTMIADRCLRHRGAERASQLLRGASGGGRGDVSGRGTVWAGALSGGGLVWRALSGGALSGGALSGGGLVWRRPCLGGALSGGGLVWRGPPRDGRGDQGGDQVGLTSLDWYAQTSLR